MLSIVSDYAGVVAEPCVDPLLTPSYNESVDELFRNVRAVLFDMDGTLVETEIDFGRMRREMITLAASYGVPEEQVIDLDILAIVDRISTQFDNEAKALRVRQEAFRKLEEIEMENLHKAREVDGASEVVTALQQAGIAIAIVTRNSRRVGTLTLKKANIVPDLFLSRDDVRNAKPHPEHILAAIKFFQLQPHQTIMVGDHWMDIKGGKAAGVKTVGFLRPDRPKDFFRQEPPDLIIRDLRELLVHFQRSYR